MRSICLFVLWLSLVVSSFAQVKTTTKVQYDSVRDAAFRKVAVQLRRVVTVRTTYKDNQIVSVETMTIESFPNGDQRWNVAIKKDGQVIDKLQLIYLGKYEYRKEGETAWTKRCVKECSESESGGFGGMGLGGTELPKVEEFLTYDSTVNDQAATVYLFYRVYQTGATLNFYDDRMWVGPNGLILKSESLNSDVFPSNKTRHEIVSYEYNPKDVGRIEAPIK